MTNQIPILYSFRRCPYAMRTRMVMVAGQHTCLLREVVLRDKPQEMLAVSPKATVPVLMLPDGRVIEESLDIMLWALGQNDPQGWLKDQQAALLLIATSDGPFKHHLDRYKYGTRYGDEDPLAHRQQGLVFLQKLNAQLASSPFLIGSDIGLADIAIFPFIRQFANVDRQWFDQQDLACLQAWLANLLTGELFNSVMKKYPQWKTGDDEVKFVI